MESLCGPGRLLGHRHFGLASGYKGERDHSREMTSIFAFFTVLTKAGLYLRKHMAKMLNTSHLHSLESFMGCFLSKEKTSSKRASCLRI